MVELEVFGHDALVPDQDGDEQGRDAGPVEMPVRTVYEGKSWEQFKKFKRELADHFSRNSRHFREDRSKTQEATRHISWHLEYDWTRHCDETNDESWVAFHTILTRCFRGPRYDPQSAAAIHSNAKQFTRQSVRNFASFLDRLQCEMPRLFDEEERSWQLWDGILPEVRAASPLVPNEDTYDIFLMTLQNVEWSLPSRIEWLGEEIIQDRSSRRKTKKRRRR